MWETRYEFWFFLVLLVGVLMLTFLVFWPYLSAISLAAVIVIVFWPVHKRIAAKVPWSNLSALLSTIAVLLLILLPVSLFGVLLFQEAAELSYRFMEDEFFFADLWQNVGDRIEGVVPFVSLDLLTGVAEPQEFLRLSVQRIVGYFDTVVAGAFRLGVGAFIMILSLFYLFRDGQSLRSTVGKFSPLGEDHTDLVLRNMKRAVNAVARGRLLVGIIQGFVIGTGLVIFGVPNPVFWGAIAAVFSMLPILGPILIIVPAALYMFTQEPVSAVGLLFWGLAAIVIIDEYLGSILVDQKMQIHPLMVLVSVLGGIALLGPIGFVLGPVILSLFFALLEIYPYILTSYGRTWSTGDY